MNTHLRLTDEEAETEPFKKERVKLEGETGYFISLKPKCRFLRRDGKCGIYEQRPQVCRTHLCYLVPDIVRAQRMGLFKEHLKFLGERECLPGQANGLTEGEVAMIVANDTPDDNKK